MHLYNFYCDNSMNSILLFIITIYFTQNTVSQYAADAGTKIMRTLMNC